MLISTEGEYNTLLAKIHGGPALTVYDLETTGLEPFKQDRLIGIAIFIPDQTDQTLGESFYVPFRHRIGNNLLIKDLCRLAPFLANPNRLLVGFNIKFDIHFTEMEQMVVHNLPVDVMLAAHLANENEMSFALKRLGVKYINPDAAQEEKDLLRALKDRGLKKGGIQYLPPEEVAPYAEQDVRLTWQLAQFYHQNLKSQDILHLWPGINEYLRAITAMERRGVLINFEDCTRNLIIAQERQNELHERMKTLVGKDFNPNSVPQLQKILGQQNTDKRALSECKHPIVSPLLKYRSWMKAASTFYQTFLNLVDGEHRIHPNLNLIGTVSGRLSCSNPNLQALPKGNNIYRVRNLVIAPPGYILMSWDWGQTELRVLAHYAKDPFFLDAFKNNKDIHGETATGLGIPRDMAKRINFGVVYGIGANALSEEINVPLGKSKEYLDRYHQLIPGVRKLYNTVQHIAKRDRKIPMWTGRLRHYREEDETHKALSNLIQGGVAEMMRIAITKLHGIMKDTSAYQILQVHDEILFEIPEGQAELWAVEIKRIMENFEFDVPIVAEGKIGYTWGADEMHPISFDKGDSPTIPNLGRRKT